MSTQIEGAEELKRRLREAGAKILKHIAPTVERLAYDIGAAAQAHVPVDRGDLSASVFYDGPEVKGGQRMSVRATVGYDAPHAPFEHEGFHFKGRKPKVSPPPKWLEHAADGREMAFAKAVGEAIRDGLEKLGK